MNAEFEYPGAANQGAANQGAANEGAANHTAPPAKKSKLIWILPIGCLGILLCCGGGGFGVFYFFGGIVTGAIEQVGVAVDTVENSTEVQAKIGTPVKCVPTGEQRQQQDGENVEITQILSVEGPEGKGEGEVVIVFDAETFKWSTKSIKVTIDGETINLSDEGDFSLDIDDSGE